MKVQAVPSYWANIYCGLRKGYSEDIVPVETARDAIEEFANAIGLCLSVNEIDFIYTGGKEPGLVVGLINYPRFPSAPELIYAKAITLAEKLMFICSQRKVTVVFPDQTVMLAEDDVCR